MLWGEGFFLGFDVGGMLFGFFQVFEFCSVLVGGCKVVASVPRVVKLLLHFWGSCLLLHFRGSFFVFVFFLLRVKESFWGTNPIVDVSTGIGESPQ